MKPKPKTQEQAVLRLLIDNNFMTPLKFVRAGIISYGQRIGDLRKMITVKCEEVKFKNKFGHAAIHGYAVFSCGLFISLNLFNPASLNLLSSET